MPDLRESSLKSIDYKLYKFLIINIIDKFTYVFSLKTLKGFLFVDQENPVIDSIVLVCFMILRFSEQIFTFNHIYAGKVCFRS